jgi:hypothetical protein
MDETEYDDAVMAAGERIMSEALDIEDTHTKAAVRFVVGLRRLGMTCEQVMAFLLMIAVDGHLLQEDGHAHMDDLSLALDGLSYALQVGAYAVRDAAEIGQLLMAREEGNA